MAAPETEAKAELTRSATTIDSLPVEMLTKVLLRVPTTTALVYAAAASRSWRGAIANPGFLARYRKRHRCSPFLGLYIPRQHGGPPSFQMPDSIQFAAADGRDLNDAAVRAFNFGQTRRYQDHRLLLHDAVDDDDDDDAFVVGSLVVHPDCRLLDCHNSRLLLTRGDEALLEVRTPLARETILLPFPFPPDVHLDSLEASLLQGRDGAAASFRVVYLQHRRKGHSRQIRQVRAVEYDSGRKSWQDHSWHTMKNIQGTPGEVMRAGDQMFCIYKGRSQAALVLDTRNMKFSVLPLPCDSNYIIGEREDNACCLVESVGCTNHRLRVWQLDERKLDWELKKDIKMDQVLGEHAGYYRPRAISNGIALVCSTSTHHHFVVDLNTCRVKEKFEFHGHSAYPMQMPWPPAFAATTVNAAGGFDRDEEPASVGAARTVAGESDEIEGLLGGAPALAEEPAYVDPCQTRLEPIPSPSLGCSDPSDEAKMAQSPAEYMEDRQRMTSTTMGSPSCPQQVSELASSRKSKGSPKAMGLGRCNWKQKPKYLEPIFALRRRRRSFSIASKVSDEVQIATSSCREASAASTAAVSVAECKLLFGGSDSTIKFTDSGKQPNIDISITSAPSLFYPSVNQLNKGAKRPKRDCAGGGSWTVQEEAREALRLRGRGRREKMPNPKYFGGDFFVR